MEELNVTPEQKAQLDRVASLMLDIYNLLVRMVYLEPGWVVPGPHDVTSLIPRYRRIPVDDSIIYLNSRLPRVVGLLTTIIGLEFFRGSTFSDPLTDYGVGFRRHTRENVTSCFAGSDGRLLPWTTLLASDGDECGVSIVYSAKEDRIWIMSPFSPTQSADPYFDNEGEQEETENEKGRRGEELLGDAPVATCRVCEGSETHYEYHQVKSRPAADVLGDIFNRFSDLQEHLGRSPTAFLDTPRLDLDLCKDLYTSQGWPGVEFNPDEFYVSRFRIYAMAEIQHVSKIPLGIVGRHRRAIRRKCHVLERILGSDFRTFKSLDEEWETRWELEMTLCGYDETVAQLKEAQRIADVLCPERVAMRPEHVPLWEKEMLRYWMSETQRGIAGLDKEIKSPSNMSLEEVEAFVAPLVGDLQVRKRRLEMLRRAHRIASGEAERRCPGQTFTQATGWKRLQGWDPSYERTQVEEYHWEIELLRRRDDRASAFLQSVPQEASGVRQSIKELRHAWKLRTIDLSVIFNHGRPDEEREEAQFAAEYSEWLQTAGR